MTLTVCSSTAPDGALNPPRPAARPVALQVTRAELWARLLAALRPARLPRQGEGAARARAYFRCHPLEATISVEQCRANRARLTVDEAAQLPFELPPWWLQPTQCRACPLAPHVDAARVPFFSADEVLAGKARQSRATAVASHWVS
jgi:hypothetical protein